MRTESLVTIFGMALATYATRAGGLWLIGRVPPTPRVERWLRYIPGAVLVAIVVPDSLAIGFVGVPAALAVGAVMMRTGNLVLAIAAGVIIVFGLRQIGFG